jgi:hypothetical protein
MDNEKFTHEKLPELFSNITLQKVEDFETRYIINAERGFFGDIVIMKGQSGVKNEWRFFLDNYPGQKKYYATNLPFRTVGDFISDMQRLGVPLVSTTPAPISEQKQEGETNMFVTDAAKENIDYTEGDSWDEGFVAGASFGYGYCRSRQSQQTAKELAEKDKELQDVTTLYVDETERLNKALADSQARVKELESQLSRLRQQKETIRLWFMSACATKDKWKEAIQNHLDTSTDEYKKFIEDYELD